MPKNNVTDLITDQEMAFARLLLSGTMTDREAAQAVGLYPDAAAYTKSKPRVRAYMLEHRAAMQKQLQDQESEKQRRQEQRRKQVLDRLWEIALLSPEMTRGSITGQVKAISMVVAIEGLIPDPRANSAKKNDVPAPIDLQPSPYSARQEDGPVVPEPNPAPTPIADPPPAPQIPPLSLQTCKNDKKDPKISNFINNFNPLAENSRRNVTPGEVQSTGNADSLDSAG